MLTILHRYLLLLPAEWAHAVAIYGLWFFQLWHFRIRRRSLSAINRRLDTLDQFPKLTNRLGLAAGFDKNAETFPALSLFGFGFIEVGSVTPIAQKGNARPRLWRIEGQGLINNMGFNNVGLKRFRENIQRYRSWVPELCLLASLGKNKQTPNEKACEDYRMLITQLKGLVDGFVINLSSPNTPGLVNLQSISFLEDLSCILEDLTPNLIKLSPDLDLKELREICSYIRASKRIAGVVLTNSSRKLAREMGWEAGAVSGPRLLPLCLERVAQAREICGNKKIIIGVGGIASVEDALLMRKAGADLIEVFTGFIYHGPKLVGEINRVME